MNNKKLYRSSENKVISGTIGGVAEYFDIDATLLRLGFVLIALITGVFPAVIAYIIAVFVVPPKPKVEMKDASFTEAPKAEATKEEVKQETTQEAKAEETVENK